MNRLILELAPFSSRIPTATPWNSCSVIAGSRQRSSDRQRSPPRSCPVVSYAAGDTKHHVYAPGEFMTHDLENIGDTPLIFATVEFLHSANAPLEVGAAESALW